MIAGLGNPGGEYAATRHNAGFWVIHAIARNAGAILRPEARFHSDVAHISFSGLSVCALAQFYKILPEEILIAHDELELPPGAVKLKRGGGSGGHNGLKDITLRLSTPDYWRLRIGIGHPRASLSKEAQSKVADFVLSPPPPEEQALIHDAIRRALSVLPDIAAGNTAQAMNRLHCRA